MDHQHLAALDVTITVLPSVHRRPYLLFWEQPWPWWLLPHCYQSRTFPTKLKYTDFKFFLKPFNNIMLHVDLVYAKLQKKDIVSVHMGRTQQYSLFSSYHDYYIYFSIFYLSHRCVTTIKMCALSDFLLRRNCFSLFFHEMLLFGFSFVYWMHTCSWLLRGLILSSTLFAISLHSSSFFIIFIFSSSWTFLLTLLLFELLFEGFPYKFADAVSVFFPTIHFVFFYKRDVQLGSILSSPISQGSLKLFVLFEFFNSLAYRLLFYASLQAGQSADLFWFVHSSWPIQILAPKGSISLHWHKCLSNKTEKCSTLFEKNTSSIQYCDISH